MNPLAMEQSSMIQVPFTVRDIQPVRSPGWSGAQLEKPTEAPPNQKNTYVFIRIKVRN